MRRGWTPLWLSVSGALVLARAVAAEPAQKVNAKHSTPAPRNNELLLAGLRPGTASAGRAERLNKGLGPPRRDGDSLSWYDAGTCETLSLNTDSSGVIQAIRLSVEYKNGVRNCGLVKPGTGWKTGHGLTLRASSEDVVRLYGTPDSRIPSTKDGQELELFYYAFDWAGPDIPQILTVECTLGKDGQPGRVVEITLGASSL